MITLLGKLFIKGDKTDPAARAKWGILCAVVAIALNVLLFAGKYTVGVLSSSISIRADAINSLTDAGSAVLMMLGFKFAGLKATDNHPFGHGRIEYVVSMIISALILVVGAQFLRDSVTRILHPVEMDSSLAAAIVLVLAILVKFYMAYFYRSIGKSIDSAALRTSAKDSAGDTVSSFIALLSIGIDRIFSVNIDGWAGLVVAALILWTGISSARDTLTQLLGKRPSPELVQKINQIVMSYPEITGMHDLVVHDYGPGRLMISLHAEVPGDGEMFKLHDAMDRAMRELDEKLLCESVIHMDPISTDDGKTGKMRRELALAVQAIDKRITIHDFRVVEGDTHTNVIFDAMVPHDFKFSDAEIEEKLRLLISAIWEDTYAVIKIDKPYV